MGKIYTEGVVSQGYSINPTTGQPLDNRLVVAARTDLDSDDASWKDYLYDGMVVAVVQDPIEENNGLWLLKDHTDSTNWTKIGIGGDAGTLSTTSEESLHPQSHEPLSDNVELHRISKTGSYNDLNDKPPKQITGGFESNIQDIRIPFNSSEMGAYPLVRVFNGWSKEMFGEANYEDYSDDNGNDRIVIISFYCNSVKTPIMESGTYILGA